MTTDGAFGRTQEECNGARPEANEDARAATKPESDARLIDQSLGGDSRAFGHLVARYQHRLFNSMVYLVGDRAEAEDVVQDTMIRCYLKLPTFRRRSQFYVWMYAVALNVVRARKRRKRNEVSLEEMRRLRGIEPESKPPLDRCERREQIDLAQAALRSLGTPHRVILILRDVEGFSYERISQALDVPLGTVRSRLHRARLELRQQYHRMTKNPA